MKNKTVVAQAPGRINIIGEHTDYNDGWVLPAAIDKKATFKLSQNNTEGVVNVVAKDLDEKFSFDLNKFSPIENGWPNYIMGVVHELQKLGADLSGFDAEFESDVPIGAGMSSSAALECSLVTGLNELFELKLDNWQLIKSGQLAEHNFVGIRCGIMDQFASVMGRQNQVMLLDARSLEFKYFDFDLGDYQLLLLNTNVAHKLASSAYNTRRSECQEAVEIIRKKNKSVDSLRDVTLDMLEGSKADLAENLYRRSRHVITENQRVLSSTEALNQKDFNSLRANMYASHMSLKDDYEVSCTELDALVDFSSDKNYVLGSRMMGGGFGGCTINIVQKDMVNEFIELASDTYYEQFKKALTPYEVNISYGASARTL